MLLENLSSPNVTPGQREGTKHNLCIKFYVYWKEQRLRYLVGNFFCFLVGKLIRKFRIPIGKLTDFCTFFYFNEGTLERGFLGIVLSAERC